MRVLFPYMARWHSANRTRFHHLLTGLAARGHQVLVFQPPPNPGSRETNYREFADGAVAGLEVVEVQVPGAVWNLKMPLDKLWKKGMATLLTRAALQSLPPHPEEDVLLLYNIPQLVLARSTRAAVVVDVADDLLAMLALEVGRWARGLIVPVARGAWRTLLARADLVTASSSVLVDRLGSKARLVPNGADLEASAGTSPESLEGCGSGPKVGFVGAFEYFVNFELLLRVASLLPECVFLLVGTGRERERVERDVVRRELRNVHLRGPVPYAKALGYMAAFDVAVIPFSEGPVADAAAPLKLFEYLSLGRPVVGTPAEELRRIASGWMEFARTPEEWAAAIRRLVARPEDARRKAQQARAEIAARYAWNRIVEGFETLLLEASRQSRRVLA